LATNILEHPENEKFQSFKTTNTTIKRDLIEVKGAVEYAVAMGFRAQVQNFQPMYVHQPRRIEELRIGAAILREEVERSEQQKLLAERAKVADKYAAQEAAAKVRSTCSVLPGLTINGTL